MENIILNCWCVLMLKENVSSNIVTGDETWALHFEPEMKGGFIGEALISLITTKKEIQDDFSCKGHDQCILGH